jgi:hypothetical protein
MTPENGQKWGFYNKKPLFSAYFLSHSGHRLNRRTKAGCQRKGSRLANAPTPGANCSNPWSGCQQGGLLLQQGGLLLPGGFLV